MAPKTYYFATSNDKKFEEVSRILKSFGEIDLVRVVPVLLLINSF